MSQFNDAFKATADLSTYQYHIMVNSTDRNCARAGTLGEKTVGILQNKPQSGEFATVTCLGFTRVKAGATITAGADFMTTASATATPVTSGMYALGRAETSVASGGIFEAFITHAGVTVVA